MNPDRFIIRDKVIRARAAAAVSSIRHEPLMEVVIREYRKNRTLAQNRLLMLWCREISLHEYQATGNLWEAEAWKLWLKRRFLGEEAVEVNGEVITQIRQTSKLDTKEFSEFLELVDHWAGSERDLNLTHPDDLYYEAMWR